MSTSAPPEAPPADPAAADAAAEWAAAMAEAEREVAEQEAAEQAAAAAALANPTAAAPKEAPRRRRRVPRKLVVAAGFALGLAGGVYVQTEYVGPAVTKVTQDAAETAAAEGRVRNPGDLSRHAIDLTIRAGAYAEALDRLRTPSPDLDARMVAYREGLCLEALHSWADAEAAYRRVGEPTAAVGDWAQAALGRVRCAAARGDLAPALDLLDRVTLRSGHRDCRDRRVLEECLHLRARLAVLALGLHPPSDALDPDALAGQSLNVSPVEIQGWLPDAGPSTGSGSGPPRKPRPGPTVTQAGGSAEPLVTANIPDVSVAAALRALAAAAEMTMQIDPGVAAALEESRTPLEVEGVALPEVLSALVRRSGAAWRIEGKALTVGRAPPATPAEREAAAGESLRRAIRFAATHPAVPATRLSLANLDLRAGRVPEARAAYQRLLDTFPITPQVIPATYNLGLVELRAGNPAAARAKFLELADREPGGRWARLGWRWVARIHADAGETEAAARALRNAAPAADGDH